MKTLNYKLLGIITLFVGLSASPLFGQSVREIPLENLSAFHSIEVGGEFVLDIQYGKQYRVQLSVEATSCVFLVSPIARTQRELIRDLLDGENIPEYFPRD